VLIAGGNTAAGDVSAELYDPSTGLFAPTGDMRSPRTGHQAVLLMDGKVLIVGGVSSVDGALLNAAELYDPYTGSFTATGSMLEAVADTATLLLNGNVLVTHSIVGYDTFGEVFVRHAELYEPSTGSFTATGEMIDFHNFPTATRLRNGDVLIAGGDIGDGDGPSPSADRYDPVSRTFSASASLTAGREGHTATLLSEGSVLFTGGHGGVPVGGGRYDNLASAELYDPASRTFRPSSAMSTGRESHQATLLNSGAVLITGGAEYYPFGAGDRPPVYGLLSSAELYTPDSAASTPYGGVPWPIPGTIQAENFDEGGDGVAYQDSDPDNNGGQYRSTGVDIEVTGDDTGGYNVGWMTEGESLTYTVSVRQSGTYKLTARVAASGAGGTFHIEFDGIDRTGPLTIPDTGGWQEWVDVTTMVTLAAGVQSMRFVEDANRSVFGNLNYVMVENATGSAPFGGTPWALPGFVEAEHFDEGLEGEAYHDVTPENDGGQYRPTGVDIETTTDTGGGQFGAPVGGRNVGWMTAGEWLKYTVSVFGTGTYVLTVRVASIAPGGTFHIEFDGVDRTGPLTIPDTGGWQTWTNIAVEVHLPGGVQVMRLMQDSNGETGVFGNVNWIEVQFEI